VAQLHKYLKEFKPISVNRLYKSDGLFWWLFYDISAYILYDDLIEYVNFPFLFGKQYEQYMLDNIHFIAEQNRITVQSFDGHQNLTIYFQNEETYDKWRLFLSRKLEQGSPTHVINNNGDNNTNVIGNIN
jgi:hypothetical protein